MSKETDRLAIMNSLSAALDAMGAEVQKNELVGYFTVLIFKDRKTGMLTSLEHHGANDYATSMLGFVALSQRRLENHIESSDVAVTEVDSVDDDDVASEYNRMDEEFDNLPKLKKTSKRKLDS